MHNFFGRLSHKSQGKAQLQELGRYGLFREKLLEFSEGALDPDKCDKNGILVLQGAEINLANLMDICASLDPEAWETEIKHWAGAFRESDGFYVPQYPSAETFRLQLYPSGYFGDPRSAPDLPIIREDIPGVLTTVVLDTPDSVVAAPSSGMNDWPKHGDELFKKLVAALASEKAHEIRYVQLAGGDETVAVILSDEVTAATHALALEEMYPQLVGNYGVLVGVPYRHAVIAKRLEAAPDKALLQNFHALVQHMLQDKPGFISEGVYELRKGIFKRLI